jgi:hypothetical protein
MRPPEAFSYSTLRLSLRVRVPAVYLNSAEGTILAFLPFIEINNLRPLREER